MKLNEYQKEASKTTKESIKGNLTYFVLGLCGESGEVAEKIKKSLRDGTYNKDDLIKEVGDVLWYLSQFADCLGTDLETIAKTNLEKLSKRQEKGLISGSGDNREEDVANNYSGGSFYKGVF